MAIEITDIVSENGLIPAINSRLDQIETAINEDLLWRTEEIFDGNVMQTTLDMAENPIINLPEPTAPTHPVRLQDLEAAQMPGAYDHGLLLGLGDDDHPQYLTEARADAIYLRDDNGPLTEGGILFADLNGAVAEHADTFFRHPVDGTVSIGHNNPQVPLDVHRRVDQGPGEVLRVSAPAAINDEYVSISLADPAQDVLDTEIRAVRKSTSSSTIEIHHKISGVKTKSLTIAENGRLEVLDGILMPGQLTSTVATGTAPFVVASTTRVANLNVATAGTGDTLTTARTLWGQSFNGSANVIGNLTSVGNITGTGAVDLSATAGTLSLSATGANVVLLNTNATERLRIGSTGIISTGGFTTPDADIGGITIYTAGNDGFSLTMKNSDVAHGVTTVAQTDTFYASGKFDAAAGGVLQVGLSETTVGFQKYGIVTTDTTSFTTPAAVSLRGALKSGTGVTSQAATANVVSVINNTTMLAAFKGNGNLELLGGIKLSNTGTVLANYEEGTWTPVIADDPTAGNLATFSIQAARYTRIGRTVHIFMEVTGVTTTGMTAGNVVTVRGLPFTATTRDQPGPAQVSNITAALPLQAVVKASTSTMRLQRHQSAAAPAVMIVSDISSTNGVITVNTWYQV